MVRIKCNPFFILFLFASFYTGYIKQSIIIFASVLVHELGHALMAKRIGIQVEEIELFPFGGIAKMEDITKYGGYVEAYVAFAGPMVSGVIAVIGAILWHYNPAFKPIALYNFILFSFNVMPALPLDGGRMLRNILLQYMSYKSATRIMVLIGKLTAIALVVYNIYIIYNKSNSIAYILTALFIYLGCNKELKYCSYYYLLHKNNFKKSIASNKKVRVRVVDLPSNTYVRHAADEFSPSTVCIIHVVDRNGRVMAVLNESDIMDAFIKYGYDSRLADIKKGTI